MEFYCFKNSVWQFSLLLLQNQDYGWTSTLYRLIVKNDCMKMFVLLPLFKQFEGETMDTCMHASVGLTEAVLGGVKNHSITSVATFTILFLPPWAPFVGRFLSWLRSDDRVYVCMYCMNRRTLISINYLDFTPHILRGYNLPQ